MSLSPLRAIDAGALAALAGATSLNQLAGFDTEDRVAALRFVDHPVWEFEWSGAVMYLTPTDFITLAAAAVLIVRFVVWLLRGIFGLIFRGRRRGGSDD